MSPFLSFCGLLLILLRLPLQVHLSPPSSRRRVCIYALSSPEEHTLTLALVNFRVEDGWTHSRVFSLIVWRCTYLTNGLFFSYLFTTHYLPLSLEVITFTYLSKPLLTSESQRLPSFTTLSWRLRYLSLVSIYLVCVFNVRVKFRILVFRVMCSVF